LFCLAEYGLAGAHISRRAGIDIHALGTKRSGLLPDLAALAQPDIVSFGFPGRESVIRILSGNELIICCNLPPVSCFGGGGSSSGDRPNCRDPGSNCPEVRRCRLKMPYDLLLFRIWRRLRARDQCPQRSSTLRNFLHEKFWWPRAEFPAQLSHLCRLPHQAIDQKALIQHPAPNQCADHELHNICETSKGIHQLRQRRRRMRKRLQ